MRTKADRLQHKIRLLEGLLAYRDLKTGVRQETILKLDQARDQLAGAGEEPKFGE